MGEAVYSAGMGVDNVTDALPPLVCWGRSCSVLGGPGLLDPRPKGGHLSPMYFQRKVLASIPTLALREKLGLNEGPGETEALEFDQGHLAGPTGLASWALLSPNAIWMGRGCSLSKDPIWGTVPHPVQLLRWALVCRGCGHQEWGQEKVVQEECSSGQRGWRGGAIYPCGSGKE